MWPGLTRKEEPLKVESEDCTSKRWVEGLGGANWRVDGGQAVEAGLGLVGDAQENAASNFGDRRSSFIFLGEYSSLAFCGEYSSLSFLGDAANFGEGGEVGEGRPDAAEGGDAGGDASARSACRRSAFSLVSGVNKKSSSFFKCRNV